MHVESTMTYLPITRYTGTTRDRENLVQATPDIAWAIVNELSAHFQVPVPQIKWTSTNRGKYSTATATIYLGRSGWRGVNTVVHEFAHHLEAVRRTREGRTALRIGYRRNWMGEIVGSTFRWDHHGSHFCQALLDCVTVSYAKVTDYSWDTEYRCVQRWARIRGIRREATPAAQPSSFFRFTNTPSTPALAVAAAPSADRKRIPQAEYNRVEREAIAKGFRVDIPRNGKGYWKAVRTFCSWNGIQYPTL